MAKQKAYGLLGIFIITYWDKSRRIFDKGNLVYYTGEHMFSDVSAVIVFTVPFL